jgi:hypothetical protein
MSSFHTSKHVQWINEPRSIDELIQTEDFLTILCNSIVFFHNRKPSVNDLLEERLHRFITNYELIRVKDTQIDLDDIYGRLVQPGLPEHKENRASIILFESRDSAATKKFVQAAESLPKPLKCGVWILGYITDLLDFIPFAFDGIFLFDTSADELNALKKRIAIADSMIKAMQTRPVNSMSRECIMFFWNYERTPYAPLLDVNPKLLDFDAQRSVPNTSVVPVINTTTIINNITKKVHETNTHKYDFSLIQEISKEGEGNMITVLFLAADPTNASRLRLGEELREIQEKLQLAKLRDQIKLEQRMSVRPTDISQSLLDVQPKIVHFSGHGTSNGALCFENQLGEIHPVEPEALAALFEQFSDQVSCVLLNACYSGVQSKAISAHIDYVIGMNQAIGDKATIAFATGFYQALGGGRSIEDSYKLGCVQIRLQNIPEHLTPILDKKDQSQSQK